MQQFQAEDFCAAVNLIAQYRTQVHSGRYPVKASTSALVGSMGALMKHCEALGMVSTLAQLKRVKQIVFSDVPWGPQQLADACMEVSTRLMDELESRKFYSPDPERTSYLSDNHFSSAAVDRFPEATADMDEAAHCFAFGRPTACIFHLMRVTEYALRAIADLLNIQDHNPTWEPIIRKIDSELKLDYKKRQFKGNQEVLANMSTHLHAVKVAWRNRTMHVDKVNNMDHAKEIYDATCGLMRYLGENLPNTPRIGVVQAVRNAFGR